MGKFITRRLLGMLLTMLLVSIVIFAVSEIAPGDIVRHILGPFATEEQHELFRTQLGLDEPIHWRYLQWLVAFPGGDAGARHPQHADEADRPGRAAPVPRQQRRQRRHRQSAT